MRRKKTYTKIEHDKNDFFAQLKAWTKTYNST